jgi:hypothetical protein
VEQTVTVGPVNLTFDQVGHSGGESTTTAPNLAGLAPLNLAFESGAAVAYQLKTAGYTPILPALFTDATGVVYPNRRRAPTATLVLDSHSGAIVSVKVTKPSSSASTNR